MSLNHVAGCRKPRDTRGTLSDMHSETYISLGFLQPGQTRRANAGDFLQNTGEFAHKSGDNGSHWPAFCSRAFFCEHRFCKKAGEDVIFFNEYGSQRA